MLSPAFNAARRNTYDYLETSKSAAKAWDFTSLLNPIRFIKFLWDFAYIFVQLIIILFFKPHPPKKKFNPYGRVAVIGAGLTGVSSAAHAIAHGFEVVLYEADSAPGGIWAHVNSTSGLQLNSLLYRFHPGVLWSRAFPLRDEIVGEIRRIWKEYDLESRTKFNTRVTSVRRAEPEDGHKGRIHKEGAAEDMRHTRWIINEGEDGEFDAVIVTVGTCGAPLWVKFDGMPEDFLREHFGNEKSKDESKGAVKEKDHAKHEEGEKKPNKGKAKDVEESEHQPIPESHLDGTSFADKLKSASSAETITPHTKKGKPPQSISAEKAKMSVPQLEPVRLNPGAKPFSPTSTSSTTQPVSFGSFAPLQPAAASIAPPQLTERLYSSEAQQLTASSGDSESDYHSAVSEGGAERREASDETAFPSLGSSYAEVVHDREEEHDDGDEETHHDEDGVVKHQGSPSVSRSSSPTATPQNSSKNRGSSSNGRGRQSTRGSDDKDNAFLGPILHSSQLDSAQEAELKGKIVLVIGSGASGVEAVETALGRGATKCVMVARDDKWIIPRNIFVDTVLAMQPFGREMPLSFLWERFLTQWHYRGVRSLVPTRKGIFESTPVVNDAFLPHVRNGRCEYVRGETLGLSAKGLRVKEFTREGEDKGEGEIEIEGDVVVLATGFEKPGIEFLPADLFPEDYTRPNLYLQSFSTEDWSILLTNSAYMNAIGTVGHFHIGIYTRILLTLLMDESARPSAKDMKLWVDFVRFLKRGARGGAFGFFTYAELTIWLGAFHLVRPDRLRWLFFILNGWGVKPRA